MRNRQNGVFDASGFESKIADFYTAKQNVAAVYEQFAPSFGHGQMPMYGQMQPQYDGMMPFVAYPNGMPIPMGPDGQVVMTPQGVMMAPRPMINYNAYMQMKGQPMKPGQPPVGMPMQSPMMPGSYNPPYYMAGAPMRNPAHLQSAVYAIQSNQREYITNNYMANYRKQEAEKQLPIKKQEEDSDELKKEDTSSHDSKQTETPPPSAIEKPDHFISGKLMQQPQNEPSALDINLDDLRKGAVYYQRFPPSNEYDDMTRTPGADVKQESTDTEVLQPTPVYYNPPAFISNASLTTPLFSEEPMVPNQQYNYEQTTPEDVNNDVYFDSSFNFDYMFSDSQNLNELTV